jgi:hypothetical protein
MLQDQGYMNTANWQITNGMTVYATDGSKLGTVRNYDPHAGYLDVHKGVLFTKDFFVPLSAVDAVAEDGITLQLTKDDLQNDRYASPPVFTGGAVYSETIVTTSTPLGKTMGTDSKGPITDVDTDPLTAGRTGEDRTTW